MKSNEKIIILTPVYNDWESLDLLTRNIEESLEGLNYSILAVNDGSSIPVSKESFRVKKTEIEILHLSRNVGHQKAISLGLSYINAEKVCDYIVVMDSDGEDQAKDIIKLIEESRSNPGKIIFAQRIKRKEKISFRLFYFIYKLIFKILTGKKINFGNFSLIPVQLLKHMVNISEIWNHYSSAIMFSKIPFKVIPIERGVRLAGKSKMNLVDLFLHGLSAISVQVNVVSVRILISSLFFMFICISGIMVALYLRIFTSLAIPGWLTNVIIGLTIIVIQIFSVCLFLIFIVLNNRSQRLFLPSVDYKPYIHNLESI